MDIFGMGFSLMSFNMSQVPTIKNFFDNNVANHFSGGVSTSAFGAFDQDSIVPGIGLGAFDIPEPPSYMDFISLTQMQQAHQAEREQFMQDLYKDVETKKNKVFEQYHYKFDDEGNPIKDKETGKPKLFEGPESETSRSKRLDWEGKVKNNLEKQHNQEMKDFQKKCEKVLKDIQNNPADYMHGDRAIENQRKLEQLKKEEAAMLIRHKKEFLEATSAHLPDLSAKAATTAEVQDLPKIGDTIDQGIKEYHQLLARHEQEELNSPAGQAINNYFQAVQSFVSQQRALLSDYLAETDSFDPDALKRYKSKYKWL